ncbi:stalk domain-containing protein [Paenibacillus alba]|uniref:Stalk domain-containing protein n=1 Tax=Paenibacillus alba TaxID=1197127 RepID=A0ABU6G609_9BACL|nr:stalk domain-containing protein [Paenibacillus alba]MEC0229608.1 stalk domain-containing protein [Paenibacillus alba]
MKKFILGLFAGVAITASGSVFADDIISKVDAYINPAIPVTLDGKTLSLDKPVAVIDGSSYLPLKTLGAVIGKEVGWNDKTQTIELKSVTDPAKAVPSKDGEVNTSQPPKGDETTPTASDKVNIGEGIIYYNSLDVNEKYMPTGTKYLDDGSVVWLINGKEINQQAIMTQKDVLVVDPNHQYWSKNYFTHYLTEEQLAEFQKFSIDFNTKTVTPIK